MVAPENTVLILLAAGRSTRFGAENKLEATLDGKPLASHAVAALEAIPFQTRALVTDGALSFPGYSTVHNDAPEKGQSHSIRLGVTNTVPLGPQAILIALADMPRITAAHIRNLLDAAHGPDAVVASSDGKAPSPPALFGRNRFAALLALSGDEGARDLIRAGVHVVTSPGELMDVDTPADLIRAAAHRSD